MQPDIMANANELLQSLLDHLPDHLYFKDRESRFILINKALADWFGLRNPAEALGKTDYDFFTDEHADQALRDEQDVLRHGRPITKEEKETWPDGRTTWVLTTKAPLRNKAGQIVGTFGTSRNITESKATEEALRQSDELFRQSQKMEAVGRLAGGVAHDFNNILSIIIGYSDILESNLDERSPLLEHVRKIKNAGRRAATLTRQLLAFSRRQTLQPQVLNMNQVIRDLSKMLPHLIGEDIELVQALAPDLGQVKVDPTQMEQVLMNLAVNARDAMPQGGTLTIETENVAFGKANDGVQPEIPPGPYVLLAVTDTGTGMDAETQAQIFEPFFTTKEPGKGTGLGLSTVYGIIKQSGGTMRVESRPGAGSTFNIYLPRVDQEPARQEKSTKFRAINIGRGSETLLLVEDERELREMLAECMQMIGYDVLTASNGSEALELVKQERRPIHVLVTDVIMPKMGGRELVEQFTKLYPETRILYMSGYADEAIGQHGVLDPDIALLHKPVSGKTLAKKLREMLDADE